MLQLGAGQDLHDGVVEFHLHAIQSGIAVDDGSRFVPVLMKPEIWRVPDASEEILGIAVYNGKLVVYYRFDCKQEALCGILVLSLIHI